MLVGLSPQDRAPALRVDAERNRAPRLIAYLLQSFAAPSRGPLPAPPTSRQTYRSLLRLGGAALES